MNGKDLLLGMNNIDDTFVEEADKKTLKRHHRLSWKQWIAAAACLGLVIAVTFAIKLDILHVGAPVESIPETLVDVAKPDISLDSNTDHIVVNEISELIAKEEKAELNFDPQFYEMQEWDKEDVCKYYGKDLTPAYVPEELYAADYNGKVDAIIKKDVPEEESVIMDMVSYDFYHDYNEDGMPKLTEDILENKGFTLTASKVGIVRDCYYIMPDEDNVKVSNIKGVDVILGYRSMPYGPYDADTHEPAGYYDLYVAQFKYDGIEYEIVAEQLSLKEVVKIVRGVIS